MFKSTNVYFGIIAGLLCLVFFEASRIQGLNARIAALQGHAVVIPPLTAIEARAGDQTALGAELAVALKENLKLRRAVESGQTQTDGIVGRVAMLKDMLNRLPEHRVPQLKYATDADWYAAVNGPLETVEDVRGALARIRAASGKHFAEILQPALLAYINANAGAYPREVGDLQPFLGEGMDPTLLQHYRIVRANELFGVHVARGWALTQTSVVDSGFDTHVVIDSDGWGYGGPRE